MEIGRAAMIVDGSGVSRATMLPRATPLPSDRQILSKSSWEAITARFQRLSGPGASGPVHVRSLGELLRIQQELSQYQLKVELVSKMSESAVASIRKLQQNQ